MSAKGLNLSKRYFRNQKFLNSLTCSPFLTLANKPEFVNRLSQKDLAKLAQNVHMWSCVPVGIVRKLMKSSNIGSKLRIEDVVTAAKAMSKAKSLDGKVVYNLLQYQLPTMTRNAVLSKLRI